jgi:hypothetical protein
MQANFLRDLNRASPESVVGRRTLCILLTPTSSSSDWLNDMSANEKAE